MTGSNSSSFPLIPSKSQICVRYYLAFENELALLVTNPEIEQTITEYLHLCQSLPRSHPIRTALLCNLAAARSQRFLHLSQRSDLDKAITHFTEAVLLSSAQHIVFALFHLAALLLSRHTCYTRPDDIKYAIKYFRFLRINFHSKLSTSHIPVETFRHSYLQR